MKRYLAIMAMIAGLLQVTMAAAVCLDTKDDLHACRYVAGDAWCVENHRGPYAYADACVKRYGKPGDSPVGGGAVVSGQPTPPSQTAWQALSSMTPSPPRPPDRAPPPPPTKDPAVAKEPTGPYDWHCLIYGLDEDFYSSCSRCQQPLTIISDAQRIGSSVDLLRASSLSGSGEIDSVFISVFTKDKTYASQIAAWKHKEQCEQMKETMLPFMKERQAQIVKAGDEKTIDASPKTTTPAPKESKTDDWYAIHKYKKDCVNISPAFVLQTLQANNERYEVKDIWDEDKIVETSILTSDGIGLTTTSYTFYRGYSRCMKMLNATKEKYKAEIDKYK